MHKTKRANFCLGQLGQRFSQTYGLFVCSIFRNELHQDALWKYSLECLKGYVDENLLSECGFHVNESEVKEELVAAK